MSDPSNHLCSRHSHKDAYPWVVQHPHRRVLDVYEWRCHLCLHTSKAPLARCHWCRRSKCEKCIHGPTEREITVCGCETDPRGNKL